MSAADGSPATSARMNARVACDAVVPWLTAAAQLNPLHHLSEGLRGLLLRGSVTWHLAAGSGLCLLLLAVLIPLDMRLLRKRVFGDG